MSSSIAVRDIDPPTIRYAGVRTKLGPMLVVASERGLCLIEFGEKEDELKRRVMERSPNVLADDSGEFRSWVAGVVAQIDSPQEDASLPLDIQGTPFQRRVWEELTRIPAGTTVTYSELARRIGKPTATRAVAGACAANRLAIAIPCHRVVRSDGKLGGYRWGIERKKKLLQNESLCMHRPEQAPRRSGMHR